MHYYPYVHSVVPRLASCKCYVTHRFYMGAKTEVKNCLRYIIFLLHFKQSFLWCEVKIAGDVTAGYSNEKTVTRII